MEILQTKLLNLHNQKMEITNFVVLFFKNLIKNQNFWCVPMIKIRIKNSEIPAKEFIESIQKIPFVLKVTQIDSNTIQILISSIKDTLQLLQTLYIFEDDYQNQFFEIFFLQKTESENHAVYIEDKTLKFTTKFQLNINQKTGFDIQSEIEHSQALNLDSIQKQINSESEFPLISIQLFGAQNRPQAGRSQYQKKIYILLQSVTLEIHQKAVELITKLLHELQIKYNQNAFDNEILINSDRFFE